jgi:hypothetical protein
MLRLVGLVFLDGCAIIKVNFRPTDPRRKHVQTVFMLPAFAPSVSRITASASPAERW